MEQYDRIHLGCSTRHIPGWFHVDPRAYPHVDHTGRVDDLSFIPDNTAVLIYACQVLQKFGRTTYKAALAEWYRMLAPGGVLRLAVPDFNAVIRLYLPGELLRGIEDVRGLVTGGQRDECDFHAIMHDEPSLSAVLGSTLSVSGSDPEDTLFRHEFECLVEGQDDTARVIDVPSPAPV